jgi:hypothetical protein
LRFVFLAIAAALAVVATVVAVSGGFRVTAGGFRISARSPQSAAMAAVVFGVWWFGAARRRQAVAADLTKVWRGVGAQSSRIIGGLALVSAVVAASFATRSASGADASGYLSQAGMWARGAWHYADPLDAGGIAERNEWLTTPLGWRPAAPGVQVPTYPPGLPLLMAVPHALGGLNAAQAVVTASAAVAVWATGMLAGGAAGVLAAALLAFAPAFLYQSIQPMSDVPVTAAWMLCFLLLVRGRLDGAAGVACALAVLIRPNLAPLALVPLLMASRRVAFAVPVAVAGAALAFLQWFWYGSLLRSGYGSADELFALANIGTNATNYLQWLVATSPALLLAPGGLFVWLRTQDPRPKTQDPRPKTQDPGPKTQDPRPRTHALSLALFASLVIASYLIYAVFEHWSYLRFLLPALAVMAVLTAVAAVAAIERAPLAWRLPALFVLVLGILAHGLWQARARDTFRLPDQLRRVSQVAAFINDHVPAEAVLVSGEQSGAMRYYTARSILRWDAAPAGPMAPAIDALEHAGRPIFIVLDSWEEDPFKRKFWTAPDVQLDWPPLLEAGTTHRTRVWRLSDRARFRNGERLTPIRLP